MFRFSRDAPRNAPSPLRLPLDAPKPRWTPKRCVPAAFQAIFGEFATPLDVAGGAWMVGRLGLEPRTKALKGPCSTN